MIVNLSQLCTNFTLQIKKMKTTCKAQTNEKNFYKIIG